MRTRATLDAGQVWRVSDPRRLRAFRIVGQVGSKVYVDVLYPPTRGRRLTCQTVDAGAFQVTGTKGLVRVK